MITRGLLDQLLKSGQDLLQNKQQGRANNPTDNKQSGGGLSDLLGGAGKNGLGSLLSGATGGALAAGAMGLLLGNKTARKIGGQALTYGGLAALGVLAYKAYGNWQSQQAGAPQGEPQTLDRLPAAQAEQHSQAILKALVAAAKADGHVDSRERELIEGEFSKLDNDPQLQQLAASGTEQAPRPGRSRPRRQHPGNGRRDVPGQRAAGRRKNTLWSAPTSTNWLAS